MTGLDIYETYHAGGVKAIFGKDPAGSWKQMWRTEGIQVLHSSRIFTPPLQVVLFEPVMRKQAFCICKNKGTDQLCSNHTADQRLCSRYIDSTIPVLP